MERKCPQCGATLEEGANICKYCGAPQGQAAPQQPPVQPAPQPPYTAPPQQPYTSAQQPYTVPPQQVPPQQQGYYYYGSAQPPYGVPPVQPPYANGMPVQPPYAAPQQYVDPALQKSKIAAGLLGIFLGCFGVHNFYLGYTGKAVGQLLLTLLSCFVLSPITWIWGLVEGIQILTGSIAVDAHNIPMKD